MSWKNSEKLRFEITGTLPFKRDIVIDWLEDECDYRHTTLANAEILIVGDNPGSKVMKAIAKKVEIVYAHEIFDHLGEPTMPINSEVLSEWYKNLGSDEKEDIYGTYFHEDHTELEDLVKKYSECFVETFMDSSDLFDWIRNKPLIIKEIVFSCGDDILIIFKDAKEEA